MEKFIFIFIHIGIPALVLFTLLFTRPRSRIGILFTAISSVSVLLFLYFWGQWPIAFSLYFKYTLPVLGIFCLIKALKSLRGSSRWFPRGIWRISKTIITVFFGVFMAFVSIQLLRGRSYKNLGFVSLEFPLKDGKYYVALGGTNRFVNNHFGTPTQAQWYALDFNKLTSAGAITSPIWSDNNNDHEIFSETVYCPCEGVVIEAKGGVADNETASMDVSPEDGMGNYIVLDCNGTIITMVHLKQNSVLKKVGDFVRVGEPIGQVGNSGFSQEPHLHFQAARYQKDSILVGIPIRFNGRTLVRNDVYKN